MFELVRQRADAMLAQDGDPAAFCIWAVAEVRKYNDRDVRHAALDGVMAALDDDEARRTS